MKTVLFTSVFTDSPATDHRFQLALMTCRTAHMFGYPIVVVDCSVDPKARDMLAEAGAKVFLQEGRGMGTSRRQACALALAEGADALVWLEPEKVGMIPEIEKCVEMLRQGSDIVIPWRKRLFTDYPPYQALSEARGNHEIAEFTGASLDLYCGPRAMTRRGAKLMMSYDGRSRVDSKVQYDDNWGLLFVPIIWALADGLTVSSCPVDYIHPAIQTRYEDGSASMDEKRNLQRRALVSAMRQEAELVGLTKR